MKISILTATRDRADVLGAALDCLDAQTFTDWEHLIQDGGTDDATANLLAARADPAERSAGRPTPVSTTR